MYQTVVIGGDAKNGALLKGRVFMLMMLGQNIEPLDIKRIYEGRKLAGDLYNKAVVAFGYAQEWSVCLQTEE